MHAGMKVTLPYALAVRPGESLYGSLLVPQRLFQTFIHGQFPATQGHGQQVLPGLQTRLLR